MNLSTNNINDTRAVLTVTVPQEVIKDEEAKLLQGAAQKIRLPGFRPGKAPVQLIKTKFAKELDAELKEKIIVAAHKFIMDSSGLNLYSVTNLDIQGDEIPQNSEAILTFTVDLKPSFDLPEYKGIQVVVPKVEVSDEEIENAVQRILKDYAEFEITEQPAQIGDYVKLSYEGKINDQPIAELLPSHPIWGTQKSTWEEAGPQKGMGVPAVVEGIIGMKAGDHKVVSMQFPDNFEFEPLAGKLATYDITVSEVRKIILPELNEDLLKKLKIESFEQLREKIKEAHTKQKKNDSENLITVKVIEYLINNVQCPVPESAVKDEEEDLAKIFMQRMHAQGLSQAQIDSEKDRILDAAEREALGRAKLHLIFEAIAKKENIEISQQDLNKQVITEAYNYQMKPEAFVKSLSKNQQLINEVRRKTLFNKVLDFLRKESKVEFEQGASGNS